MPAPAEPARSVYVGIDAGGSGTRAWLADANGTVIARGVGGPSGVLGRAAGRRQLERALASALAPIAPLARAAPCVAHIGLRGITIPGRREAALLELQQRLPNASRHASSDASIALHGALGDLPGVAVLAGTGSIALARDADGREARAGGYGYLLGDEGSAYWLGREGVMACLRGLDGREPRTALHDRVCERLRCQTPTDIVAWLYDGPDQVPRLALLAPLVTAAAAEGDAGALAIVRTGAEALASMAVAAAHQLPAAPEVIVCSGGVWSAGEVLVEPFEAALRELLPGVQRQQPRLPPVGGAVLLAMRADGVSITSSVVAALSS